MRLRFVDGRVGINLGDILFAQDVDDGGDGDFLMMKYDVGSAALFLVMQFTRVVVRNIINPVVQSIIYSIKYSMMQLFVSYRVDLGANFVFADCIYTTVSITNGIVTCNLDEGDGVNQMYLPLDECSILIDTYNSA